MCDRRISSARIDTRESLLLFTLENDFSLLHLLCKSNRNKDEPVARSTTNRVKLKRKAISSSESSRRNCECAVCSDASKFWISASLNVSFDLNNKEYAQASQHRNRLLKRLCSRITFEMNGIAMSIFSSPTDLRKDLPVLQTTYRLGIDVVIVLDDKRCQSYEWEGFKI